MPRNKISLMLLLWTLISRGVSLRTVTGVLHGRVELQGCSADSEDVQGVNWVKHQNSSSPVLLCIFERANKTFFTPKPFINCSLQNMSLVFENLTADDEGIYQEKIILNNGTARSFNFTLSVLSPPVASRIDVSCYNDTLTLRCEVIGDFVSLQWMQNGLQLPADQRFVFTEMNTTMQVSNLTSVICSTYTCSVSNEAGFTQTHVNITGDVTEVCLNSTSNHSYLKFIMISTGITCFLVLLFILTCICKFYGCFKSDPPDKRTRDHREQNIQMQEPVYDEPLQEGAATPEVKPLPYVYSDFIKPKASHQTTADQAEDFGYSTIPEILNTQPSQNLHSLKAD